MLCASQSFILWPTFSSWNTASQFRSQIHSPRNNQHEIWCKQLTGKRS